MEQAKAEMGEKPRREAEAKLRAAMPFPLQLADPAKLGGESTSKLAAMLPPLHRACCARRPAEVEALLARSPILPLIDEYFKAHYLGDDPPQTMLQA